MAQRLVLLALVLTWTSCSTPEKSSGKEVKTETKDKRKAPIIFSAKQGDYYFNLHDNAFFDYFGTSGILTKTELYAGTYTRKGDSLLLGFHNNFQPEDLTGKAYFERSTNTLVLLSKIPAQNRRMPVILNDLK
jgi:hypothetical protein